MLVSTDVRRHHRQLPAHSLAADEADDLHGRLQPGTGRVSVHPRRAVVFPRQDHARPIPADRVGASAASPARSGLLHQSYQTLASYKATLDRLTTFNAAMETVEEIPAPARRWRTRSLASGGLGVDDLKLGMPTGRTIVSADGLNFQRGETTLIGGPSGCGKTTLFRALAGIWPFAKGKIRLPKGASVMLLPQRPYIPLGTLTGAVAYPAQDDRYTPQEIREVLKTVGLARLIEDSSSAPTIGRRRLSRGEQQRLAIARALLQKPDWLLLDEATLGARRAEPGRYLRTLLAALPNTTVISIGHRSSLVDFHKRHIQMTKRDDGLFAPKDATPVPA